MESENEQLQVERVVAAIESDEGPEIDHETLIAVVEADVHRYASTATVTDFIPVLVEKDIRARIRRHREARPHGARGFRY